MDNFQLQKFIFITYYIFGLKKNDSFSYLKHTIEWSVLENSLWLGGGNFSHLQVEKQKWNTQIETYNF